MQKITVPLTGATVTPEGAGPQPGATAPPAPTQDTPATPAQTPPQQTGRPSLHQARLPRPTLVEGQDYKWEWGAHGKAKMVPVQAQEAVQVAEDVAGVGDSTVDAGEGALDGGSNFPPHPNAQGTGQTFDGQRLEQQVNQLTQLVSVLAQTQLRGSQPEPPKPAAPQAPDPSQVDWYDPAQVAEYHRTHDAYIDAKVQYQVNAALEPHGSALQDAELNRQYNTIYAQHGQEPNFKAHMQAALQLVANTQGKLTIPEAYAAMASIPITSPQQPAAPAQPTAKPAQRTITAQEAAQKREQAQRLPASNGVSGAGQTAMPSNIRTLGQIMLWNRQNGRAN